MTCGRIISQHFANFVFGEPHHFVESWREGVVGANIEATGQVIHCYGADTSDKTAFDAGICSGFYFVEEGTQITFFVCLVSVAV